MAKIPGPVGTAIGVIKVAKSAYKAAKRVQANKKNLKSYKTRVLTDDAYGLPTTKPVGGRATSKEAFVKKVQKKLGKDNVLSQNTERTSAPYKASQERKVRDILDVRSSIREANMYKKPGSKPTPLPRYKAKRPKVK